MSRAIHIDNVEYPYKVWSRGVKIWLPDGRHHFVEMTTLTGWSNDELERAARKGYWPAITPSVVKEYLTKFLLT